MRGALGTVALLAALVLAGCGSPSQGQGTGAATHEVPEANQVDGGEDGEASTLKSIVESSAKGVADMESEELDPRSLDAETVLSDDDIRRAGGVDALFWAEEIPDDVFARMQGKSFGEDCTIPREDLSYLRVLHKDAEGATKVGEMVVNASVAQEVVAIFRELYDASYPIRRMRLVDDYEASDDASCMDDNSSCFNFRRITGGTTLSNHAYGLAIDINTYENVYYIPSSGYVFPPDAGHYVNRDLDEPYMIHRGDLCYRLFTERGWSWGGDWQDVLDYQHFEKPPTDQ